MTLRFFEKQISAVGFAKFRRRFGAKMGSAIFAA
jgi:hypothetical protein